MKVRFLAAAVAAIVLCGAADAPHITAPPAVVSAVTATESAKAPYAFDIELAAAGQSLRAHFDPRATPHVTLLQPSADHLTPEQHRAFDALQQQLDGVSWCAGPRLNQIADARPSSEDAASVTYAFQPTRESMRGQAAQYADHLRGELTVTKASPDVSRLHVFLPAAFDPLPLVHIARFDVSIACATAPNGRLYAAQTNAQVAGSAFGQSLDQNTLQRVSGLSAAP